MPDWKRMLDEIDGDLAALEASKAELLDVRAKIEARLKAESAGTKKQYTTREQSGSISDVTRKHHALAIAKGRVTGDEFRAHITSRGFSQNRLAKKVGCSVAALSRYRDNRPVPQTIANRIERETGWPADAGHWPGGLV